MTIQRVLARLAAAGPALPDGMAPFVAGTALLAVPVIGMVASTTAPTEPGHWVVVLIGVALMVYGLVRGIDAVR